MIKIFSSLFFWVLLFNANVVSAQQFEVVVCESCTTTAHFQAKALEQLDIDYTTSFIQKAVVIANLHTKVLRSYLVLFSNEPGFYERAVYDAAIPADAQTAFDIYLDIENSLLNSGKITIQSVPETVRAAMFVNSSSGSCGVSGDMNPVPPYVANSVKNIDGDIDGSQKAIREMLRNVYFANGFSWIQTSTREIVSKFLYNRPLSVWTTFNDGSKVQWLLADLRSTLPFILLPQSAVDSNCNPISMGNNNYLSFNGGSYSFTSIGRSYYNSLGISNFGNRVCNIRHSGTTSEGISEPQLVCY